MPLFNVSHLFSRAPLEVAFSLLERVDQKDRILGKKTAWGRVGWTEQKKEKRMRKKGGVKREASLHEKPRT